MKEKLIILSDLWGREKSSWLDHYTPVLEEKFHIVFYDSCELGEIDTSDYRQDHLHAQFVNGGIEKAVEKLRRSEKDRVHCLAFSIGGTIAWKFGMESGKLRSLTCVSSTGLRKEAERPKGRIALFYGENDAYRPDEAWLKAMKLNYRVLSGKGHEVYREPEFARQLSGEIVRMIFSMSSGAPYGYSSKCT